MDVTAQAQQIITFLHQKTLVAPLKKMAGAFVPPIEKGRVGDVEPVHPTPQIGPMCLRQQVNMIPHQHKAEQGSVETSSRFLQELQEADAITIIPKDPLPGIAPRAKMIDRILKLHSKRPGHA
jgi:hypothetical protein